MIGYLTIGADDIAQAKTFYDSVLGTIGWQQFADYGDPVGYAQNETGDGQTIWICKPFDGGSARAGNGIMVGFDADIREQVHAFHAAAIKAGGSDAGPPGPRPAYGPNWYAAYLRDPTGNKLAIVCRKAGIKRRLARPTGSTASRLRVSSRRTPEPIAAAPRFGTPVETAKFSAMIAVKFGFNNGTPRSNSLTCVSPS